MAKFTRQCEWNIFNIFLPSTLLVRLFLMAHCSVVKPLCVVFILQRELMCVRHMQEYLYANRVRVGPHPQQITSTSGSNKIQSGRESNKRTLRLHLILVERWVLGTNLPPVTKIIVIIPEN